MKFLYNIKTVDNEHAGWRNFNVLATTAEEAIKKVKPKFRKNGREQVEEIEVLGEVDIE